VEDGVGVGMIDHVATSSNSTSQLMAIKSPNKSSTPGSGGTGNARRATCVASEQSLSVSFHQDSKHPLSPSSSSRTPTKTARRSANQRESKLDQRERDVEDIKRSGLFFPPSKFRDPITSIRCPPPNIRTVQCRVKGKWCSKPLATVLQTEFHGCKDPTKVAAMMQNGTIRVNDEKVEDPNKYKLKNMDVISRIMHWHEPPVVVPATIPVQKVVLPIGSVKTSVEAIVYIVNKPSTVPVHAAGPYLHNALATMMEAQLKLEPRALYPCHRIDRVTSGLTIFCTSAEIAKAITGRIQEPDAVRKLYFARVQGHFPDTEKKLELPSNRNNKGGSCVNVAWRSNVNCGTCDKDGIQLDLMLSAPIATFNASEGKRIVSSEGKVANTEFKVLTYNPTTDSSIVLCSPLTGRTHQLRVHLQWLGHPICGDLLYGATVSAQVFQNDKSLTEAALQALETASLDKSRDEASAVDRELLNAAIADCLCCKGRDGCTQAFDRAQLLEAGHAIDLHAWRYTVQMAKDAEGGAGAIGQSNVVTFEVEPPSWVEKSMT
jgi:23S rRNA-/tRNA-specific pseudouridylate synthase